IHASDFEVVDLTPAVTGLNITTGPTGGGTAITITGRNFSGAAGNLHITFGTVEATNFTIVSDTQIDVVTPPHAAGTVDVRVTSGSMKTDANSGQTVLWGYGASVLTGADWFTFAGTGGSPPAKTMYAVGMDSGGSTVRVFKNDGSERYRFD